MSDKNQQIVKDFLRSHPQVEIFEAILPDVNGNLRGKWIPAEKINKAFNRSLKIPRTTLGFDVWGRDVESWVLEDGDADGICIGDSRTLSIVPWLERPTAQLLVSMEEVSGEPCAFDPRNILKDLMARFEKLGFIPVVASEMEFHLFRNKNDKWGRPLHTQNSQSGRATHGGNTYSMDVMQQSSELMHGIIDVCKIQNLPIDTLIKEAARSQYEINLFHQPDALLAADQGLLLQRAIKGVAKQLSQRATFMAKPLGDIEGNGMHIHCSLMEKEGNNVFNNGTEKGDDLLHSAIAGCLKSMKDCMLLFAPNLNSYRRFQRGNHAPTTPSWGYDNRTVSVRVPADNLKAMRLEHRVSGADANPYLVITAILAGMLHGLENKLQPPAPLVGDASEQTEDSLPRYWPDAIKAFEDSTFIKKYFGQSFQRVFSEAKKQELTEFDQHVSIEEYDAYL